ncbi:MAG: hypothetical protein LQ338_006194, partial [Usnochroma carphineum]
MAQSTQDEDNSKSKTSSWEAAVLAAQNDLPPDLQDLRSSEEDFAAILRSLSQAAVNRQAEAQKKRLKIPTKAGKVIVVRDAWGKVLGWIKRFQAVGDVAIQADAGYASLPWAAVVENETYAQMLEGIEVKRAFSGIKRGLNDEVNQLQKQIDKAKARVDSNASIVHQDLTQSGINVLARTQESLAAKGDQILGNHLSMKGQQNQILIAQEHQAEQSRVLVEVLESWQRPLHLISDQILDVRDAVDLAQTTRVSNWLSTIRVDVHHTAIQDGRLPSSGKWLLQHSTYRHWVHTTNSSVLWMHGLLGTGKTNLVSTIIDELHAEMHQQNDNARLAYFYCTRNKAGSESTTDSPLGSEPTEIFRSLLKQLAKSEKSENLDVPVTDKYYHLKADVDEPRRLTISECIELIISIAANKATSIVIDALDECLSSKRTGRNRDTFYDERQIFLSTRPVSTVVDCLRDKFYASLEVNAGQNSDDITNFIRYELDGRIKEKQLLHGHVSEDLRKDILSKLSERAGSMFWYASLQLNLLCDPTAEQDESSIRAKLTELPATLKEAYADIVAEITSSKNSESSREIAQNTFKWLLCAQESLPYDTFLEAISSTYGQNLEAEWVRSICRSLISQDEENDRFEFAHLSVREHLEQEQRYNLSECHLVAAERCLRAVENSYRSNAVNRAMSDPAKAFSRYASLYWPFHYQRIDFRDMDDRKERLRSKLKTLLVRVRDVSPIFRNWISQVESMADRATENNNHFSRLQSLKAIPATPLFAASIFGFTDLIKQFRIFGYDVEQLNVHNQTALCLAVENDQLETVKAFLEDRPGARVPPLDVNRVNLCAVEQFEDFDPRSPPKVICFATALQAAALKGNIPIARYLLEAGARIDSVAGYYGNALQAASLKRHTKLVKLFLEYGAEPNTQGGYHGNALQAAAYSGDLATVSALVDYGALVPMPGGHYGSALMAAVESCSREVVELLLNYGKAQMNRTSKLYGTPLQRAAELDCYDIVEVLVTEGAEMNVQSSAETYRNQLTHNSALTTAAWGGHSKIVSILLRGGAQADVSHQGEKLHLLHQAASRGMLALAEYCIDTCACDANMMTNQLPNYVRSGRMTPLSFACGEGQIQMVQYLLSRGSSLEFDSDDCFTLWLAARRGHSAILRLLLETSRARKDVHDHSKFVNRRVPRLGTTALYAATQMGSVESVELLLDHGASFEADPQKMNPLHVAIEELELRLIEVLANRAGSSKLEGKCPIDAQDYNDSTPLSYAVAEGNLHKFKILLTSGADTTIRDNAGNSVLHVAARLDRVEILQELFAFQGGRSTRSQLGFINNTSNTPLVEALRKNNYGAAVLLLQQGAHWPDNELQTNVLHQAVANDESSIREFLSTFDGFPIELHAFLASPDGDGKTALHYAAETGHSEALDLLLQNGAHFNTADHNGYTPLMYAAINGHDHCASNLLEFAHKIDQQAGRFIDHRNSESNTALHEAIIHRRNSVIHVLIESGADVFALSRNDTTALHLALLNATNADNGQRLVSSTVAELLEKARTDGKFQPFIDYPNSIGATALFIACEQKLHKVAQTLVNCGADCFISNRAGASPLHIAAHRNSAEFAESMLGHLLVKYGQEPVQRLINQRDKYGMTPLNVACRMGSLDMIAMLGGKFKADYTLAGNNRDVFPGYTPLHSAVWTGSAPSVQTFLKFVGRDTDARRKQSLLDAYHTQRGKRSTALIDAANSKGADVVKLLLAAGADYSLVDEDGCTALHKSVSKNDGAATRALLDFVSRDQKERRRLLLNHRDRYGRTALTDAVRRDLAPVIASLLRIPDIDYTVRDLGGFTALHWGARRDKLSAVGMLLDITSQDKTENGERFRGFINCRAHQNGVSALFLAAGAGHADMTEMLLKFGAEYDTFDDAGYHPLRVAVEEDFFDVVQTYLSFAGRDKDRERCRRFVLAREPVSGLTMEELAERNENTQMQRILGDLGLWSTRDSKTDDLESRTQRSYEKSPGRARWSEQNRSATDA